MNQFIARFLERKLETNAELSLWGFAELSLWGFCIYSSTSFFSSPSDEGDSSLYWVISIWIQETVHRDCPYKVSKLSSLTNGFHRKYNLLSIITDQEPLVNSILMNQVMNCKVISSASVPRHNQGHWVLLNTSSRKKLMPNFIQYKFTLIWLRNKTAKISLHFLSHQRRKKAVIFILLNHSEMTAFIWVVEDLFHPHFLY